MTAGSAGVLLSACTPRRRTRSISDVRHVIVLMQENRSFDHYFGTLGGVRGFDDRSTILLRDDGDLGAAPRSVLDQPNGSGRRFPFRMRNANHSDPELVAQCQVDIPHDWADQHEAWHGGRLDQWVRAKGLIGTLGYLDRTDLPFYYALADAYTVCDAYHCSGLTATGPNRTYTFSGWIDPHGTAGGPAFTGGDEHGLRWLTYAESLQKAGVSWRVYQNASDNFTDNALAYFDQFANAPPGSPLHDRGMASVPLVADTATSIVRALRDDIRRGALPEVSWIVTDELSSEHPPGPRGNAVHGGPPVNGERFVGAVLDALGSDSDVWNSTIVFLCYDENGGFFDHVPPPVPPPDAPDAGVAEEYLDGEAIGLGFRVPLIAISPWTRGGWVSSQVFDHTSIIRFLETWTSAIGRPAHCPHISPWRRAVCGDLTSVFDFSAPVHDRPKLPSPGTPLHRGACKPVPNPTPRGNSRPSQESGRKRARALPYQPNANVSRFTVERGSTVKIWISMTNEAPVASEAVHFAVYANRYRTLGPWQYTVHPRGSQTDFFNIGAGFGHGPYDLTVVGPNRFLRRLTGNFGEDGGALEARCSYGADRSVRFVLSNDSTRPVQFEIASNHYRGGGPWQYYVPAGGSVSARPHPGFVADGWYDYTVTALPAAAWARRFTGHVETGQPSLTG